MITPPINILIFEDSATAKEPFFEWIHRLDRMDRARILSRLDRVEQGNLGDFKSLGEGLFELRFSFGSGYRIYFGMENCTLIILLTGGSKSQQKKDIKQAHQYWDEYKREKSNERV